MKSLDFQLIWPHNVVATAGAADATFANLRLLVEGDNTTAYVDQSSGAETDHIDQPMLYLAEWIVENWWSLLWEPEKTEDPRGSTDHGFLGRHSLLGAQQGFALPDVRFTPTGANIQVFSKPRVAEYADARFTKHAKSVIARATVANELCAFVEQVIARIPVSACGELREAWRMIRETDDSEADFCKLMGAMGLSPYETYPRIEAALDAASAVLSRDELFDLCQSATAEDFVRSAKVAGLINGLLDSDASSRVNLEPLAKIRAPGDNLSVPAFRRGQQAARDLRKSFGVSSSDISGASRIFDRLELDYKAGKAIALKGVASPLSGATARLDENVGNVAIVHQALSSRRFAAARGTYFLWTGGNQNERRLITNAVTRSQQASRAFAAELLIPQEIVRSQARRSRLSWDQVNAIAEEAMVASDVVRHQAENCGLQVVQ